MKRSFDKKERMNLKDGIKALKFVPRFFRQVRDASPKMFYGNIALRLISAGLPVLMLWLGKLIVDEIIFLQAQDVRDFSNLWWYIGIEFGLVVLSDLIGKFVRLTDGLLGDLYSNASSIKLIKKTADLQLSQLEDAETYDKLERARRQTTNRVGLMSSIMTQAQDFIVIISLLGALIAFEPWLILLLILSVVPSVMNEIKFSGTSYSLIRSWTQERREIDYIRYAGASDVTAKEVKLFGLADYLAERFRDVSDRYYLANKALSLSRVQWGLLFTVIGTLAYYGSYVLIAYKTVIAIFTLGDLTFLSGSFNRLRGKLANVFSGFTYVSESALYLQDYFEFLDLNLEQDAMAENLPLPEKVNEGFVFENVGFKYPNTDKWILRNINFELKQGEKLALVGENGAGKTTLIKLLLQFYEPTEGAILLDGIDIRRFDRAAYQEMFGVIFQDFVKYDLSFKENVAVGKITDIDNLERLEDAISKSLASEVVNELPDGYEQQLGKRFRKGLDLSGGQWQKIALARAYMKNADFLILDEPTAALDARSEYEAFQRFIGLTEGKTSVIISHRFSTVRLADRILVLEDGRILELGTHEELLHNDALYAELFELQAAGYA